MSTNNSQSGHTPLESLILNNENESNINQLLSVEIVNTSQPSSIPFNTTNMIPNLQQHANVFERHHTQREHQHPQQFRQRQERQQQQEEQQQQRQRQLRRRERRERRYEQWHNRVYQRRRQRERDEEYFNEMMNRDPLEEPMEEDYNEILLDTYYYERMNPQERQEI
jgi:hypothetical protein